jgi:hypothetical protein
MAVTDSGTRHRLHRPTRTCAGCGQPWACYVVLAHRATRWRLTTRERAWLRRHRRDIVLAVAAAGVWLALVTVAWWRS